MANKLLVHIGMPKTGTTALQNFLSINNDILEKYGWSYPSLNEERTTALGHWEQKTTGNGYQMYDAWVVNNFKPEWDKWMKIVLKLLEERNVIISAENIYECGTNKFIEALKEEYENIKVAIYLRRQDRAIESRYNEHVKAGDKFDTFQEFVDSDDTYKHSLEYKLKLDEIGQIVGKENVIVRVYEKQQLTGNNTITDFLSVLEIPTSNDDWKKSKQTNVFLGGNYLEIKRIINSVRSVDSVLESKNGIWSWSDWNVLTNFQETCLKLSGFFNQEKGEHGFFTLDKRKEFLGKFASCNEQVAREYLHREDGILFYDSQMEYPTYELDQSSSFETDIIRVFAAMMYVQDQRAEKLLKEKSDEFEDKYKELKEKTHKLGGRLLISDALQKAKGRKLMFFGAGHNCKMLFDAVGNITEALIVDNDVKKRGDVLGGIEVKYAGDIVGWQEYFVVVTCWRTGEIEEQLCSYGLKKEKDYILMNKYDL